MGAVSTTNMNLIDGCYRTLHAGTMRQENLRLACVFAQFCNIVIINYERVCGHRKVYDRKQIKQYT